MTTHVSEPTTSRAATPHAATRIPASSDGWLPAPADRVVEVYPPDATVIEHLRQVGRTRYLGLLAPGATAPPGAPTERFVRINGPAEIHANNADVVVLNGAAARHLWYGTVGRARWVVVPAHGPAAREARLAARLRRRLSPPRPVTWGGREFLVFERTGEPPPAGARHYLSPVVGIAGLPDLLERHHIRYSVLRWFDALPHVEPGEDLDVLVADDDVAAFRQVLADEPGTLPIDMYSASGLPGTDFHEMAYYPPRLADEILAHSAPLASGFRAPTEAHHFRSLAYHALYHKGATSGLPSELVTPEPHPEHDYLGVLSALAGADGFTGAVTMETLDEHLARVGWRPPRDTLAKLATTNEWVRTRFRYGVDDEPPPPWLSVFVVRERAATPSAVAALRDVLARHGFTVLAEIELAEEARRRCRDEIRGGNWGAGPFPVSGGEPAFLVVALDVSPRTPTAEQAVQHPGLTNANTVAAKLEYRDALMADVPAHGRFNPVHSSDNHTDAVHYLELGAPDLVSSVLAQVDGVRATVPDADRRPPEPPAPDAGPRRGRRGALGVAWGRLRWARWLVGTKLRAAAHAWIDRRARSSYPDDRSGAA